MAVRYAGEITAAIIEIRFAYSGKVAGVGKKIGDRVKQWEWIASLDKKPLQADLDLELSDYERVRADFEMFKLKNGADGGDDIIKYERQQKQSSLNASVRRVEIAKARMDQADLISPVTGVITDMEGMVTGVNVTPASAPVKVLDTSSLVFVFAVPQNSIDAFLKPQKITIRLDGLKTTMNTETTPPIFGSKGAFTVRAAIQDTTALLPGLTGTAQLS